MVLTISNYTDFLAAVESLGKIKSVFYREEVANNIFVPWAVVADGKIAVTHSNFGTRPAGFLTDFPSAILVTGGFGFSG